MDYCWGKKPFKCGVDPQRSLLSAGVNPQRSLLSAGLSLKEAF